MSMRLSSIARFLSLSLLALVATVNVPNLALGAEHLSADEIRELLTGRSVKGRFEGREWVSQFAAGGETTYTETGGRPSLGRWKAEDARYCSLWPPSDQWECYRVLSEGETVTFVAETDGSEWVGRRVPEEAATGPVDGRIPQPGNSQSQTLQLGQYSFEVQVPAGFRLELLTHRMERPRVMHFFGKQLLIGSRAGAVYVLDPPYIKPRELARLDDYPHSMVVHEGHLYIARTGRIDKIAYTPDRVAFTEDELIPVVKLPGGRGHNSRTLKVGPDQQLYVSLGITGNCSDEYLDLSYPETHQRGGFFVVDETVDPPELMPYASGLRNPVGFDWHPATRSLFATNNGPDHLGYESPAEYFVEVKSGNFFGMPWFQYVDGELQRDGCIERDPPLTLDTVKLPSALFAARSAPMDMVFLDAATGDGQLENSAIVALHGSWATANGGGDGDPKTRRHPKLLLVEFSAGKPTRVSDFVTGFQLEDGARWARPMGLAVDDDGDIYFTSDDGIQGLYRLTTDSEAD